MGRISSAQQVWLTLIKFPSADIVDKIKTQAKTFVPFRVGEVCQLIPKDHPDLRGKSGMWCIVTHVGEFSCTATTWEGEYILKPEHLKSLNFFEDDSEYMREERKAAAPTPCN